MDVHTYRVKKQGLFGFSFHEAGRIIEPKREARYTRTGRYLQLKFAIPDGQPIFIFNATEHPSDRLKYLVIVGLATDSFTCSVRTAQNNSHAPERLASQAPEELIDPEIRE